MKKNTLNLFFIFIFVFFCLNINVFAEAKYIVILDSVNVRKGPGTNYSKIALTNVGNTYNLKKSEKIADEVKNGSCNDGWYEIDYNGESAYVCSEYVKLVSEESNGTPKNACEIEMQKAGFPSSYWGDLCSLKEKHPKWTFKALQTNLDWRTAVEKESACGKSKISTGNTSYIDYTCKADEGSFKAASKTAVAFYMDPRNFLDEQHIFQFEYLMYEDSLANSYTEAIVKILGPAEFYKYHTKNNVDFAKLTNDAGKEKNINPISLAARMYQEMGTSTKLYNLYSGVYESRDKIYYGYYNFYNIGVNSSCVNDIVGCGLGYAKSHGWNTPYNAIKGGADLLSNNYLSQGQFTSYLQKFNVKPNDIAHLYLNQYMTNIVAPSSEATTTYQSYLKMNLVDSPFAFYIPVYLNMSATIDNSGSGATGENGSSSSPSTSTIPSIISMAGFKVNGNNITGIKPNSNIENVKGSLDSIAGRGNVTITNLNNATVTTGLIGTGFKVTIKNSTETKTYEVAIKGDVSGDGKINALDLLQIQKSILGTYKLGSANNLAADPSGDGKINALDLLQVQKHILGTYTINQ